METKFFELRDAGTFIPVLCVQLDSSNEAERYLLARAGYGPISSVHRTYVLMMGINGGGDEVRCDPNYWVNNRTRACCHQYIITHWDELKSGDVVDYEFVTGLKAEPKTSERLDNSCD